MIKYYKLIKDNDFYGKQGTIINQTVYNNLPSKHQELFEECKKESETPDHNALIHKIRRIINNNDPWVTDVITPDYDNEEEDDEDEDFDDYDEDEE